MRRSQLVPVILAVVLLLTAVVVGLALAQGPSPGSEPDAPLHPPATPVQQDSSQPVAPAGAVFSAEEMIELTDAQRNSSAPISPDGVVPAPAAVPGPAEDLPHGVDALVSLRIPGTALKPRNSNATYVPTAGGGCFYATASSYTIFNIGVFLPQGAWVDTVRLYYYDTSATDSTAWFSVYDLYGNIVQEWAVDSSGNSGDGFHDTALISHTIDYSLYSYAINWRPYVLGATMQNCGFRIFYQAPPYSGAYLPAIWRDSP
jgi:hypothetical protein